MALNWQDVIIVSICFALATMCNIALTLANLKFYTEFVKERMQANRGGR